MKHTSRRLHNFLEHLGRPALEQISVLGEAFHLYIQMFRLVLARSWRKDEILQATIQITLGSLPIITIATAFAGMVITHEIAYYMDRALSDISMVPGATGQIVLRELGVVIPAFLMVSKMGAAITAEVGSMAVTEQIDALRLLQINPVQYLVYPRWIASVFAGFVLTLTATFVTLSCAVGIAILQYHFSFYEYLNALRHYVGALDLVCTITKGLVFGSLIPVISCAYGFNCKGGAQGVGTATTQAVVTSTIAIIICDFILTYAFTFIL